MVSLTSASNALKNVYLGVVANQLNTNANPLLSKIEQSTSDVWGKQIIKLAPYGINGGIGAGTETGSLPNAAENQYVQFVTDLKNLYGKISISDKAIAKVALKAALDCYGIVNTVANKFSDTLSEFLKLDKAKGVNVQTVDDRIYIDLFVMVKFGVSISAVAESLKQTVKYAVEDFTGMIVNAVNVNIVGVRL